MASSRQICYLLRKVVNTVLIAMLGARTVVGFGLSSAAVWPSRAGLRIAGDGALVSRTPQGCCSGYWACNGKPRRRIQRKVFTCKVAPPRKYGSSDWLTNMLNLPKSRLLYNVRHHLFANTGFAFLVSLAHALSPQHIIDDLHVSPIPHTIMSGALGLLLVFRTNAAYNRFWEARKVWGNVVNTCRNLTRLAVISLGPASEEWDEMKEYVKMFPYLLKQHLQNERNDTEVAFSSLSSQSFYELQENPNPPLLACQRMSEIVARAFDEGRTGINQDFTSVTYRIEMEHCLSSLIDCLGMCERILTTPVPRGYSRHTSRFLTVYGLTLPVVLVPHTELFTAPVVGIVCWGLFSIEEIAYFIEQPFDPDYHQLNLAAYSAKVRADVDRMTQSSGLRPKNRSARAGMHGWAGEPSLTTCFWPGPNGHRRMTVNGAASAASLGTSSSAGAGSSTWVVGSGRRGDVDGAGGTETFEVATVASDRILDVQVDNSRIGAHWSRVTEDDMT